jgi:hypothetical protein
MRRDRRGLDHRTLETIRLMAVERVRFLGGASLLSASPFGMNLPLAIVAEGSCSST